MLTVTRELGLPMVKPQKKTAKPQHWLVTTWRETTSWLFLRRAIFNFTVFKQWNFSFSISALVEQIWMTFYRRAMLNQEDSTGSVDQTQLDSASESEKKWANHKQFPSVFVSRAVQKVMLVGCDWWFSIPIFFIAEKPLPTTRTCTVVNFHNLLSLFGQFGSLSSDLCLFVVQNSFFREIQRENLKISRRRKGTVIRET